MGMITFRRYRGAKAREQATLGQTGTAGVHKAAVEADTSGTPLPAGFPGRNELAAATPVPYTRYEDLYAATRDELTDITGIGMKTADRILEAYNAWDAEQS